MLNSTTPAIVELALPSRDAVFLLFLLPLFGSTSNKSARFFSFGAVAVGSSSPKVRDPAGFVLFPDRPEDFFFVVPSGFLSRAFRGSCAGLSRGWGFGSVWPEWLAQEQATVRVERIIIEHTGSFVEQRI